MTLFGGVRWPMGDEECLMAFYDAPDLVHDIMDHLTDVYLAAFEAVAAVATFQSKHPGLAMMGGVDKRALVLDHEGIDAELERVRPAVEHGRYIPHLDHNIPNDVSWENYKYFARRLRELVGKP